jgi:lysophospholipase L1-like esterase
VGFGDSLTFDTGYPAELQVRLQAYFGRSLMANQSIPATKSGPPRKLNTGANRIGGVLAGVRPAYTLILYGTNDWNDPRCLDKPPSICFTIDSLGHMVNAVQGAGSLPFLATLPPVRSANRNEWVAGMNDSIRALARNEGAVLVDLHKAFLATPNYLNLLLEDGLHPNAAGRDVMIQTFFDALTKRQAAGASRAPIRLGFTF